MTKKPSPTIADLRALLSQPPSTALWREIWDALNLIHADTLESSVLPYVKGHLESWPPGLRFPSDRRQINYFTEPNPRQNQKRTLHLLIPLIDALDLDRHNRLDEERCIYLCQNPLTENIHTLYMGYVINNSKHALQAFLLSKHLTSLKHLHLGFHPKKNTGLCLKDATWFSQLEHLKINYHYVSHEYHAKETPPPWNIPGLKSLAVGGYHYTDYTIGALVKSEEIAPLEHIDISGRPPSPENFEGMLMSFAPTLKTLSINHGFRGLAAPLLEDEDITLENIEEIDFSRTNSGVTAYIDLLSRLSMPNLKKLSLNNTFIQLDDLKMLARNESVTQLETLELRFNESDDQCIQYLGQHAFFSPLKELYLRDNRCKLDGLFSLIHSPYLTNLERLSLRSNPLTVGAIKHLAKPHNLSKLRWLDLSSTKAGDKEILNILANPTTPQLESIGLKSTPTSIPFLYFLCTSTHISAKMREHTLDSLINRLTKEQHKKQLTEWGISELPPKTLPELAAMIKEHIVEDHAALIEWLCHPQLVNTQPQMVIRATFRALKVKGYSKLSSGQMNSMLDPLLQERKDEFDVLREQFEKILSSAKKE